MTISEAKPQTSSDSKSQNVDVEQEPGEACGLSQAPPISLSCFLGPNSCHSDIKSIYCFTVHVVPEFEAICGGGIANVLGCKCSVHLEIEECGLPMDHLCPKAHWLCCVAKKNKNYKEIEIKKNFTTKRAKLKFLIYLIFRILNLRKIFINSVSHYIIYTTPEDSQFELVSFTIRNLNFSSLNIQPLKKFTLWICNSTFPNVLFKDILYALSLLKFLDEFRNFNGNFRSLFENIEKADSKEFVLAPLLCAVSHLMGLSSIGPLKTLEEGCVVYTVILPINSRLLNAATDEDLLFHLSKLQFVLSLWEESSTFLNSFGLYKRQDSSSCDRSIYNDLYNAPDYYRRDRQN
ncbi:hypothetical protein BpHYR1_048664 [Brachionus plicatilis]|uniref:Uncharacterized protein n=1 Tax=Brachionus plicatilis TaxID=10195 RepID=A0A3M7Q494_BRAPC|nr:hypothetical protein BpHYR1_048664 [Brachionus plicatilis]